jgi:flagellin
MRINQNIMAFNAYRNLTISNSSMGKSLEKLSSGFRINRAADDAAGLVISQGLRAQTSGLRQATRNAQDGISVVQTAEGALNELHNMLNRMRDLAVQSANTGTQDTAARNASQAEINQLSAEIDRIVTSTKFGQQALLDGSFGVQAAVATGFNTTSTITIAAGDDFQIDLNGTGNVTVELAGGTFDGAQLASVVQNAIKTALSAGTTAQQALAQKITVESTTVGAGFSLSIKAALSNTETFVLTDGTNTPLANLLTGAVTAAAGSGGVFQVGANSGETINVSISALSAAGLGVAALDVVTDATTAISAIDAAITNVSTTRGSLGAVQNRFESTIANLQVATENLTASESRIRDTDMAEEMVRFTRSQILQQAGTAMLAQANAAPQSILRLLNG